jgi:homoserine O-acetyltransferase
MSEKPHIYDLPDSPHSVGWTEPRTLRLASSEAPMKLEGGASLGPIDVEFETYGALSTSRDNVVLVAHALSGDAHVAGWDKTAEALGRPWRVRKPGWWDPIVGPGKPLDTNRFAVICANVLGSCYGTTGPPSLDPSTGRPYGLSFPVVTVGDWVRVQARLLDALGIQRLRAVVGGSLGGQQALEWALAFPDRVDKCIVLAASPRLSTQGLGFNAVGRFSIMNDPHFRGGEYYGGPIPHAGLAAARMLAHITYLSESGMHSTFGRKFRTKGNHGFGVEFEVESYLDYQGKTFVERFDANSYLYVTRAMDYYDAAAHWGGGDLVEAVRRIRSEVMVASFSSDWLYPPARCKEFALALCRLGKPITYVEVPSHHGHDAFLVETDIVGKLLSSFLADRRRPHVIAKEG